MRVVCLIDNGTHKTNGAADETDNTADTIRKNDADQCQVEPEHIVACADRLGRCRVTADDFLDRLHVHRAQTCAGLFEAEQCLHHAIENKQNQTGNQQTDCGSDDQGGF